jgi:outer membrane protein assembly factor BamB/orotate phosphoribosyltransferase
VEIGFESSDRPLENAGPGLIPTLEAFQHRIVNGFARRLEAAHLVLARDRYREFIGNQEAIGRELEWRLVAPSWGEADYTYYISHLSVAGSLLPRFGLTVPLAFGHELGASVHAHLYPGHGRRDAVAELCALFNLLISIFDWVTDCRPDAHNELAHVFGEDTVRRLSEDIDGVSDLQRTLGVVQNPAVRVLIKTMSAFFTNLHASARISVSNPAWARLNGLLVQAYRAEIVTTGLNRAPQSISELLGAAHGKSVLPFEIILAIAAACEDQPMARNMDDAIAFVRSIGRLMAVADEVSDLARDYRSGDANTILLNLGIRNRNGSEVAAETREGMFAFDSEECVDAVVERLYENVACALCFAESGSDSSNVQRVRDVIIGYAQGWLRMTELGQCFDYADVEAAALKRALLTDAVKIAQGIRRDGSPCTWLIDGRAAMLRSNVLQLAARRLWQKLRHYRPTAVGGVSLGADPIVVGLMLQAQGEGWPLKGFMIRQVPKKYGLCRQVEGPDLNSQDRVALVDDLIGGGTALLLATECIEPFGPQIVAAGGVVDLRKGGAAGLRQQGIPVETLFTEGELGLAVQSPLRPDAWKLLWSVSGIYRGIYWAPKSSPSSSGGRIYLGSDAGYVACFTAAGEERWRYAVRDTLRGVHAKPLILDGKVYFGAYDGFVYCVDAEFGNLRWETRCAGQIVSSAASTPVGGQVYVSGVTDSGGGVIVALSAETGHIVWRFETQSPMECSPSFHANRSRVIAGADDGVVYAVDSSSGEEAWRFSAAGAVKGAVAIDSYSRCFVGSENGFLYALDGNSGAPLWKRKISNRLHTQPLLCSDLVVSAGDSKRVVAIKAETGEVCWIATLRGPHVGGAALVAEKWIAIGCDAGTVYLLDREHGLVIWTYNTGGSIRSTPAIVGDRLLVPSTDSRLYCFGEDAHE